MKSLSFSVSRRGIHGMFPLHLAALNAHADCCRKLLSSGTSTFGDVTQHKHVIVLIVRFFYFFKHTKNTPYTGL